MQNNTIYIKKLRNATEGEGKTMKTLIMILLTVFVTVNGVSDVIITEENIQEYISADCESVANYIVDNLQLFAQEYNNQLDNESLIFEASYCELMLPVYVVSTEQEGIYLDFDGDNGYMVVVDDYLVLAFETSGDLEYLKDVEYTYYSIYDGFLYLDESGEYLPFDFCAMSESDWGEYSAIEMEQSYAGQDPYVY